MKIILIIICILFSILSNSQNECGDTLVTKVNNIDTQKKIVVIEKDYTFKVDVINKNRDSVIITLVLKNTSLRCVYIDTIFSKYITNDKEMGIIAVPESPDIHLTEYSLFKFLPNDEMILAIVVDKKKVSFLNFNISFSYCIEKLLKKYEYKKEYQNGRESILFYNFKGGGEYLQRIYLFNFNINQDDKAIFINIK